MHGGHLLLSIGYLLFLIWLSGYRSADLPIGLLIELLGIVTSYWVIGRMGYWVIGPLGYWLIGYLAI
jgi:hypothetical protein